MKTSMALFFMTKPAMTSVYGPCLGLVGSISSDRPRRIGLGAFETDLFVLINELINEQMPIVEDLQKAKWYVNCNNSTLEKRASLLVLQDIQHH